MLPKKLLLTKPLHAAFIVLTMGFFGCNSIGNLTNSSSVTTITSAELNNNLPKVVATTSVLCDLTKQIAQETVNLTCLISPDTNPHLYQPTPEDSTAVEEAKLILYHGYNLEPKLLTLIQGSQNPAPKIAVAQTAVPKPLQFRQNGKTVSDPYIWHNPNHTIKMVEVINTNLGKVLPENASIYSSNAKKITNELTQLDSWIKSRIASIPATQRKLVTSSDAMGYYAKAYNLEYAGVEQGISTGEQPVPGRTKALVQYVQQASIPTVFPETTNNPNSVNGIAQQAQVKVSERKLFTDNLGVSGSEGDTYQKMMEANTRTIVEGLGGTYLIFQPQGM
jgi:manganese/iron transport system substrate-binding protein